MRKSIAAVTVGLLLVAGQAAAANEFSTARVGDRVGARAGASSEFQAPVGGAAAGGIFGGSFILPIVAISALVAVGVVATDDGGQSES
jgi:hypothetical protein